jgi:hypothetical protein
MPETIHCRVKGCGKAIYVENFADQMKKIRKHRQLKHPRLFKQSIKKGVVTRKQNRR